MIVWRRHPVLLALVLAVALAGLARHAGAETKLRVGKAQAENFHFAVLDVGMAAGIFQKHGLAIESFDFGGSAKLQQALAADSIDIGLGSGPELAFVAKGAPVLGIAAMADAPRVIVLTVLKDGPVHTVDDLRGRLVSISTRGSLTEWLTQELARQHGWGTDGIKTLPLGTMSAQTAALKTHQIDGMVVEISTGYRLEAEGNGRVLVRFGDLIKDFHLHVIYARRALLAQEPDAVRAFLAAWFETVDHMRADRAGTVAIAARVMGVSDDIAGRIYDELMPAFNRTGRFRDSALATLARSYVEMGILPAAPDMRTLVTEQYLPGASP